MKIITDERCTSYEQPGHPERPERIIATVEKLRAQTELPISWSKPGPSDDQAILRAHTPEHLKRLNEPVDFDADTPYFPKIAEHAKASVGAALQALKAARAGAHSAHAGFAVLDVSKEKIAQAVALKLPGTGDPSVLVVRRPGKITVLLPGVVDSDVVAEAVHNAR